MPGIEIGSICIQSRCCTTKLWSRGRCCSLKNPLVQEYTPSSPSVSNGQPGWVESNQDLKVLHWEVPWEAAWGGSPCKADVHRSSSSWHYVHLVILFIPAQLLIIFYHICVLLTSTRHKIWGYPILSQPACMAVLGGCPVAPSWFKFCLPLQDVTSCLQS